jgi:hypothetical protein
VLSWITFFLHSTVSASALVKMGAFRLLSAACILRLALGFVGPSITIVRNGSCGGGGIDVSALPLLPRSSLPLSMMDRRCNGVMTMTTMTTLTTTTASTNDGINQMTTSPPLAITLLPLPP